MKYYESNKKKFLGGAGFYIIVGFCLVAIGAAAWFAMSKYNSATTPPPADNSRKESSYNSSDRPSSDTTPNNSQNNISDSSIVNQTVSDLPDNRNSSEAETPKEEVKPKFILPVEGNIGKDYSDKNLQYSATYGDMRLHTGVDIQCDAGAEIKSAGAGTVTSVEQNSSLGNIISIDHGSGIIVKYCGLDKITLKGGDKVQAGTKLGVAGTVPSECKDKNHIHIEVTKNNAIVSPLKELGIVK